MFFVISVQIQTAITSTRLVITSTRLIFNPVNQKDLGEYTDFYYVQKS